MCDDNLSLDRPLRLRERAALQGFPAILGKLRFDEATGRRIWGNAMSVPVLGSILAQELICLQDSLSTKRLQQAIGRPASEPWSPGPSIRGWPARYPAEEEALVLAGPRSASGQGTPRPSLTATLVSHTGGQYCVA